jgi:hypothetical protein
MKKLIASIILWEGWIYGVGLFLIALVIGGYWALALKLGPLMALVAFVGICALPFFAEWLGRKWKRFVKWCEQQRDDSPGKKA